MASVLDNFANNCTGRVVSGQLANTTNPVTFSVGASDLQDPWGNALVAPFTFTVWNDATYGQNPAGDPNMEILHCTSRTGASITASRAQEGSTAVSHAGTPKVMASLTAGGVNLLNTSVSALQTAQANTMEPTGFLGQSDSTISFNYSTLTFTIAPVSGTFTLYMRGTLYAKSTETVTLPSTSGTYYIYYNSSAVLTQSTTVWDIAAGLAPVAVVYLNTTMGAAWLAEERHNCIMDWATHKNLHFTQGTKLESGGTASGYVLNTAADGANTYAIAATTIADEDIIISLSALADAGPYCLWYPSGAVGSAGLWLWNTTNGVPFLYQAGGYIQYSQLSGSTWGLTQLTSGQFVNYYLIATNYQGQAAYILISGQAVYTSLFAALAETPTSLNLAGLPILEWVLLARFTYSVNSNNGSTGYVQTVNAQQYLISNVLLMNVINPANHSVLSNRGDASSHPAAAIAVDVTQFGGALGPTDTTVQQALQDLSTFSEPNAAAPSSDPTSTDRPHSLAAWQYSMGYNPQAAQFAAGRWL